MMQALSQAAERGVTVKLILPGIPDKKIINLLTKAHCKILIKSEIEIYEYTSGFVHAKGFICDDEVATVGSVNVDYRSLYNSFECGFFFYQSSVVKAEKEDFEHTLKECRRISNKHVRLDLFSGIFYAVLRILSPLL